MGGTRARHLRRQRQQVERRRAAQAGRTREAERAYSEAAARGDYEQRLRRHRVAYGLWVLAAIFAISHLFEHLGMFDPITGSAGLDDLLVGWPMAGVLGITGAIVYGT